MNKTVGFLGGKFLPFHLGHLYAIMSASNYVDKLYVILASNIELDTELCEKAGIPYIPVADRLSWIGKTLKDIDNIEILTIDDYGWADGSAKIIKAIPEKITHIFSSEESYGEYFNRYYPDAEHIVIDNERSDRSISGTMIRNDVFGNWEMIPTCARPYFIKKVCIVGTESCGKSTLTKKLAKYYNTNFVHEVGRDYSEEYKNQLTNSHFDSIAMDHYRLQETLAEQANKVMFIDSDAIITNYYADMYGYKFSSLIDEIANKQDYDLYIYLEPDVKWVDDGLRFSGNEIQRAKNNRLLKSFYHSKGVNFVSVSGSYRERFEKSKELIDELFI